MKFWYQPKPTLSARMLQPLSWLYRGIISLRQFCYQKGLLPTHHVDKPVIIIGNISVGGTGKTPVVIELANQLQKLGLKPGVVSRGYGGQAPHYPFDVHSEVSPEHSGDEPLLIAQKTNVPVVVDPNRARAAEYVIAQHNVDIVLADDGLQHYALARDLEIVVRDPTLGEGNGLCIPAGPLREPRARLSTADLIIEGNQIQIESVYSLIDPQQQLHLTELTQPVHAIAGIAHPQKFFSLLREQGLDIIEHAFPDHHPFTEQDLQFPDDYPVLMTEKDAVKCIQFVSDPRYYAVAIKSILPKELFDHLHPLLNRTTLNRS